MDMQGERVLAVTREQAWAALNDPEVLKLCIPGCEKIEATGEHAYAVTNALKIGPVSAKFNGKIQLSDVNPPESYTLGFEGQGGAAGFGKGQAQVRLAPQGEGHCQLSYNVNAQVGGKIAQVGQRLIDGVARSMAEDFFRKFDEELQRRHPAPAATESEAGGGQPAPSDSQKSSKSLPTAAWVAGGVVVLLVLWWLLGK